MPPPPSIMPSMKPASAPPPAPMAPPVAAHLPASCSAYRWAAVAAYMLVSAGLFGSIKPATPTCLTGKCAATGADGSAGASEKARNRIHNAGCGTRRSDPGVLYNKRLYLTISASIVY